MLNPLPPCTVTGTKILLTNPPSHTEYMRVSSERYRTGATFTRAVLQALKDESGLSDNDVPVFSAFFLGIGAPVHSGLTGCSILTGRIVDHVDPGSSVELHYMTRDPGVVHTVCVEGEGKALRNCAAMMHTVAIATNTGRQVCRTVKNNDQRVSQMYGVETVNAIGPVMVAAFFNSDNFTQVKIGKVTYKLEG